MHGHGRAKKLGPLFGHCESKSCRIFYDTVKIRWNLCKFTGESHAERSLKINQRLEVTGNYRTYSSTFVDSECLLIAGFCDILYSQDFYDTKAGAVRPDAVSYANSESTFSGNRIWVVGARAQSRVETVL